MGLGSKRLVPRVSGKALGPKTIHKTCLGPDSLRTTLGYLGLSGFQMFGKNILRPTLLYDCHFLLDPIPLCLYHGHKSFPSPQEFPVGTPHFLPKAIMPHDGLDTLRGGAGFQEAWTPAPRYMELHGNYSLNSLKRFI